jgi:peptidoglycan/xylan/chitin deacetylase (PgdA/CDA1 family)
MSRLAILNYHNIDKAPRQAALTKLYVTPRSFAQQCWLLRNLGLRGVSMSEGLHALERHAASKCVALTFDDGYVDNLTEAAPILREFGFTATCYIVADRIGSYNAWDAVQLQVNKPLMDEGQLLAWLAEGHEIGSHTLTHPRLTELSDAAATQEIVESREKLQRMSSSAVDHFCYPYGYCAPEIAAKVRAAGYRSAVTTSRGLATRISDAMQLPRVSINGGMSWFKFALKAATPYAAIGQRERAA